MLIGFSVKYQFVWLVLNAIPLLLLDTPSVKSLLLSCPSWREKMHPALFWKLNESFKGNKSSLPSNSRPWLEFNLPALTIFGCRAKFVWFAWLPVDVPAWSLTLWSYQVSTKPLSATTSTVKSAKAKVTPAASELIDEPELKGAKPTLAWLPPKPSKEIVKSKSAHSPPTRAWEGESDTVL